MIPNSAHRSIRQLISVGICVIGVSCGLPLGAQPLPSNDPTMAPAAPVPTHVIRQPRWERTWDPADPHQIGTFFPERAMRMGVTQGQATLRCVADADGMLRGCSVAAESPAGWDFGAQAIKAARNYKLQPLDGENQPVAGGQITLRINFVARTAPST